MPALSPVSVNVPARQPAEKANAGVAMAAATAAAGAAGAKRKPKASSLCYTPPAMINDRKRDRSYFRRNLLGEVCYTMLLYDIRGLTTGRVRSRIRGD